MGRTYDKDFGGKTKAKVEAAPEVVRTAGAKEGFELTMTYENGFLFDPTRQFKYLCPVQMENGDTVKVVAARLVG